MKKHNRIFVAAVSVLALLGLTLNTGTANANTEDDINVVQLGDSYSSGNGSVGIYEKYCNRSSTNYGQQAAQAIGANYRNVACGGAVAAHVLDTPQWAGKTKSVVKTFWINRATYPNQAEEWMRRMYDAQACGTPPGDNMFYEYKLTSPAPAGNLFTATLQCQLYNDIQISAVNADTDAVFMTIGGNDAAFESIAVKCIAGRAASACQQQMKSSAQLLKSEAYARIKRIFEVIDERTNGKAHVFLLGYPDLLNTDSYTLPEGPAGWYNFGSELRTMQNAYNAIQQKVVDDANAKTGTNRYHFIDVRKAFGDRGLNPYLGGSNSTSWIVPILSNLDYSTYVHPRQVGWDAEAKLLESELRTVFAH